MRLVIVSSIWDINQGGAIGIAVEQARQFQARGHQVFVFAGSLSGLTGWHEDQGIKIYHTPVKNYRYFWRSYLCLRNLPLEGTFKKFLQQVKPEIVHFHNLYPYLPFFFLKIAKKITAKVFFTAHDVMTFSQHKLTHFIDKKYNLDNISRVNYKLPLIQQIKQDKKAFNPARNYLIRHYLKSVTKILAVSYELKKALQQNRITNLAVAHNGIEPAQWQANQAEVEELKHKYNLTHKKVVLFAGRLSAAKGTRQIELAMQKIIKLYPTAVLLVLDSQGMAKKIALPPENLIFAGSVSLAKMKNYYHLSQLVVVPSVCFDSFPTVNLEAMACRKPVIATIFGGSRELVEHKKTGFIVNPLNIDLLADKILYLLKNDSQAQAMGERGYQKIKREFNTQKWVNEMLEYYSVN